MIHKSAGSGTAIFSFLILSLTLAACNRGPDTSPTMPKPAPVAPRSILPGPNCTVGHGSLGPSESGIINGTPLSPEARIARGVAFVFTKEVGDDGKSSTAACTGLLVSKHLILTAAHCVRTEKGLSDAGRAALTNVIFSVDPVCEVVGHGSRTNQFAVQKVVVHESYDATGANENDLALIFLAEDPPQQMIPIKISFDFQAFGPTDTLNVAGYGRETDLDDPVDNMDLRLRYAVMSAASDPAGTNYRGRPLDNDPQSDLLVLDASRGSSPCSGDSGGPALILKDGRLQAVGVASFVYDKDFQKLTCLSRSAYSRTSYYRDWIFAHAQGELGDDPGPTHP